MKKYNEISQLRNEKKKKQNILNYYTIFYYYYFLDSCEKIRLLQNCQVFRNRIPILRREI